MTSNPQLTLEIHMSSDVIDDLSVLQEALMKLRWKQVPMAADSSEWQVWYARKQFENVVFLDVLMRYNVRTEMMQRNDKMMIVW